MSELVFTPRKQEQLRKAMLQPPYPEWDAYIAEVYGWDALRVTEHVVFKWDIGRQSGGLYYYSDFMRMIERTNNFILKMEMMLARVNARKRREREPRVGIEHTRNRKKRNSREYRDRKRGKPPRAYKWKQK